MNLIKSFCLVLLLSLLAIPAAIAQSNVTPIADVLSGSPDEQIVTIQGRLASWKEDDKIYVQDPTGKILVELEDEQKLMSLKTGEEILVQGEVDISYFFKTKKIEAITVERFSK